MEEKVYIDGVEYTIERDEKDKKKKKKKKRNVEDVDMDLINNLRKGKK